MRCLRRSGEAAENFHRKINSACSNSTRKRSRRNDEVIETDQDPLGRPGRRVSTDEDLEVWAKEMGDGTRAVGLFNRGEREAIVTAKWADLGLSGKQIVRDLWRQKDLGEYAGRFQATVARHGVVLVRLRPARTR